MSIIFWIFIIALLILIGGVIYALFSGDKPKEFIPIAISLLAVLIAVLSAFKAELFPVQLVVSGGDLVLSPQKNAGDLKKVTLALSLGFLNKGYGEDIVEWVGVKIAGPGGDKVNFVCVAEADMAKVLQGIEGKGRLKKLHATNTKPFMSFALHAKSSVTKTFVFAPADKAIAWQVGSYQFDVYVKLGGEKKPHKAKTIPHEIDRGTIQLLSQGNMHLSMPHDFTF